MRGKAQAKDISLEHLEMFFQKTEMIENLTLTGGEVSLVPKLINSTLDLAQKHKTKITHCGIITNGLYITDAFIEACKRWLARGSFNVGTSTDMYHKDIPPANLEKLKGIGCEIFEKKNNFIQESGRALALQNPHYYQYKCITKPNWLLNGWIMQCTYLNALGEFVNIDGSYEEQREYRIGDVYNMSYDIFIKIHPYQLGVLDAPFGIIPPKKVFGVVIAGSSSWSPENIIQIAKQGSNGPTLLQFCPYDMDVIEQVVEPTEIKKAS